MICFGRPVYVAQKLSSLQQHSLLISPTNHLSPCLDASSRFPVFHPCSEEVPLVGGGVPWLVHTVLSDPPSVGEGDPNQERSDCDEHPRDKNFIDFALCLLWQFFVVGVESFPGSAFYSPWRIFFWVSRNKQALRVHAYLFPRFVSRYLSCISRCSSWDFKRSQKVWQTCVKPNKHAVQEGSRSETATVAGWLHCSPNRSCSVCKWGVAMFSPHQGATLERKRLSALSP